MVETHKQQVLITDDILVDDYNSACFKSNSDTDANQLNGLGYKQEFKREVSLFAQVGLSFLTMAMLPGWFLGFNESMNAGGPMSLFWGYVPFPINGGVYSWCRFLSNNKWSPFVSQICGYMFLAGVISAVMATGDGVALAIIGIVNVSKGEGQEQFSSNGAIVGIYTLYTFITTAYCTLGIKYNEYLNRFLVIWTILGTLIICITLPVMSPSNPSPVWVFTEFNNQTGYSSSGIAFFLGILPAAVTMIGYENGAHISEGTKNAAITGPHGILISVASALVQGIILSCTTLFSIQNVQELQESSFPIGTLFIRSTNQSVTIFFLVILIVCLTGCSCSMLLSGAQMIFSMARDGLLPYHRYWYSLDEKHKVPLRALLLLSVICILAFLPSLASEVYLAIVLSTTVIFLNTSYCIPSICRLVWRRHDMPKGPFNLGRYSILIHMISIGWILFIDVIMCMPRTINPLSLYSMNWSCVMFGFVLLIGFILWFIGNNSTMINHNDADDNIDEKQ
ncbi:hypothetical protein INT45_012808 [Circinella minor]|uniref:Amino acid/polyamine transporter I n=1 Tax=Circinella minor TaxID=1195481 RepID=A0A8H7S2R2_9FUNG|nr:hypothetical protein INT45_012808 [Circinella minor]